MNDIPERPLGDQARARRKAELMNAIEARQKARRWFVPTVAAAAVIGVVSVGAAVGVVGGDDGAKGPAQPAGHSGTTSDSPDKAKGQSDMIRRKKEMAKRAITGDAAAKSCADLDVGIKGAEELHSIEVGETTVRVYGNGDQYVTCDEWASQDGGPATLFAPRVVDAPLSKKQLLISMNFAMDSNASEYVAGGVVPAGVDAIRYKFSDGHTQNAVIEDGTWAMAYFPDKALADNATAKVTVTSDSGADEFTLSSPADFCGQVNHGC